MVVGDLLELVALRNQAARKLGFKNYYVLQLYCGEQSQEQVLKLFDQLDELTREPFHQAKAEIDAALAKSYGIAVAELRPWHYHDPFFQEVPAVLGELPESVYKPLDPVKVCRAFYDGIGLPIDDVLKRSSLYEKPGKNPHAFCIDIDRRGRRPRAGEHRARPGMAGHLAARVGPQRVFRERVGRACRTCCTPTPIRSAPRAWP